MRYLRSNTLDKPIVGALPFFGSPFSFGLTGLWAFNEVGGISRNLISNVVGSFSGTSWGIGPFYTAIKNNTTSDFFDTKFTSFTTSFGTVFWLVYPTFVVDATTRYFWGARTVPSTIPLLEFVMFSANLQAGWQTTGNDARVIIAANSSNVVQNQWNLYSFTWDSNVGSVLYLNGIRVGSTSTLPTPVSPGTSLYINNGNNSDSGTSGFPSGSMTAFFAVFNTAMSSSKILQLSKSIFSVLYSGSNLPLFGLVIDPLILEYFMIG